MTIMRRHYEPVKRKTIVVSWSPSRMRCQDQWLFVHWNHSPTHWNDKYSERTRRSP